MSVRILGAHDVTLGDPTKTLHGTMTRSCLPVPLCAEVLKKNVSLVPADLMVKRPCYQWTAL